jgi:hypothetical protein
LVDSEVLRNHHLRGQLQNVIPNSKEMTNQIFFYQDYCQESPSYVIVDKEGNFPTHANYCDFCEEEIQIYRSFDFLEHFDDDLNININWNGAIPPNQVKTLGICNCCGFWFIWSEKRKHCNNSIYLYLQVNTARGVLKEFNSTDETKLCLNEMRADLVTNYHKRFDINPKFLEDIVASSYKNIGFDIIHTPYSNDKGVDIFILNNGIKTNCIQVKRYKNKIEADDIRAFAGAMVLNNCLKGTFVTTSSFTSGANLTASEYKNNGIEIELKSGIELMNVLKCSLRSPYDSPNDSNAPYKVLWNDLSLLPKVGEVLYMNAIPLVSTIRGFSSSNPEVDKYNLIERTTSRAIRLADDSLKESLLKLKIKKK